MNNDIFNLKDEYFRLDNTIKTLEAEKRRAELSFIQAHGLCVNELSDIEDETEFFDLLNKFVFQPEVSTLNTQIMTAENEKKAIDNALIDIALTLAPEDVAADMQKLKNIQSFREKTIAILFKNIRKL